MTRTVPWRRITLHFSQILFTLGLTFIACPFVGQVNVSGLFSFAGGDMRSAEPRASAHL
jgi:hypothetical protein